MAEQKKRVRDNAMKTCMIVNQLQDDFYIGWSQEELKAVEQARHGDASGIINVVGQRLFSKNIPAVELHGIIHNSDWRTKWDDVEKKNIKEKKPDHIHIVVKFYEGDNHKGAYIKDIADAVGMEPNMIEKAQKGRFAYDNMLAYLIHAKDADKALYDPHKVYSSGLQKDGKPLFTNYMDIYSEHKQDWQNGRAKKTKEKSNMNLDLLLEMILTGQVTRSQVVLTDDYYNIYAHNSRTVDDAFRAYGERRAYKTLQALENGEYKLSVFFITGDAGAGKTRLAKAFVDALIKASADYDDAWRVCHTAATNPMDDYNGEEILFMDDVRGSALSASDWLKLLDPYNASPASARYHNKMPVCRAIIITSTKEPVEFFYYCKAMGGGDRSEALDQFMRRIQCLTRVIKADDFADTKAMIAESKQGKEYIEEIGGGMFPDKVRLTYNFDDEHEYSFDDAITKMTDIVKNNNDVFVNNSANKDT